MEYKYRLGCRSIGVYLFFHAWGWSENQQVIDGGVSFRPTTDIKLWQPFIESENFNTLLIIGEPGSGKSRLLEYWHSISSPAQNVNRLILRDANADNLAAYQELLSEHKGPLLIDGLDELALEYNQLFGHDVCNKRCFTIRKSHFIVEQDKLRRLLKPDRIIEVQPFSFVEIEKHLEYFVKSESRAKALSRSLLTHPSMRLVAGTPIVINLLGHLARNDQSFSMPKSRLDFYREAILELWCSKYGKNTMIPGNVEIMLKKLAKTHGNQYVLNAVPEESIQKAVECSLLKHLGASRTKFEFIHATFQSFYYAQALAEELYAQNFEKRQDEFKALLIQRGRDKGYEEHLSFIFCDFIEKNMELELISVLKKYLPLNPSKNELGRLDQVIAIINRAGFNEQYGREVVFWLERVFEKRNTEMFDLILCTRLNTPQVILTRLSKETKFRRLVARNQNISDVALGQLVDDEDPQVRGSVASNIICPKNVLESLAGDQSSRIRRAVAENVNTPENTLENLSKDHNVYVRNSVAENINVSRTTLEHLTNDKDATVRRSAALNERTSISVLHRFICNSTTGTRTSVVRKLRKPTKILEFLSQDKDSNIRSAVARNINTPLSILRSLAKDKEYCVRRAVASNTSTPRETLYTCCLRVKTGIFEEL